MKKLMSIISILISFGVLVGIANAEWAKTIRAYPRSGARCVEQTNDGGYIILAQHGKYYNNPNYWVIKLDSNNDIEWQNMYDVNEYDVPYAIEQTSDGGYIIVGNSSRSKTWILKLDTTGDIEWEKYSNYNSVQTGSSGSEIKQTLGGGYVLTDTVSNALNNRSHYDFNLMQLNSDGSVAWRGIYGNNQRQSLKSLQVTNDGGYIISGHTEEPIGDGDDANFSVLKISAAGTIIWQKQYASDEFSAADTGAIVRTTSDGGLIIGGNTFSSHRRKLWIIKTNTEGNISWQKGYFDSTYGADRPSLWDIKQVSDGNYIYLGFTHDSIHNRGKIWIVKIDQQGSVLWDKAYTFTSGNLRTVRSIEETSDGGFIIGGSKMLTRSVFWDIFLMKINENGDIPGCDILKEENFTQVEDINGQASDTNFSEKIITSPSIEDIVTPAIKLATSSTFLCFSTNSLPSVNAGEDMIIASQEIPTTIIHGFAGDEDDDLLQYRWIENGKIIQDWLPVGAAGECPLELSSIDISAGTYVLKLEVSDGDLQNSDDMNLVIGNTAPYIALSGGGVYSLGSSVSLDASISDYDGDYISYEWKNGENILCYGNFQTFYGGIPVNVPSCAGIELPIGNHIITLWVSDGDNIVKENIEVSVIDDIAPNIAPNINTNLLWPPNHKMVDVIIYANASDNSGGPIILDVEVSSNELEEGLGDGDMAPDWTIIDIDQAMGVIMLQLRAERSGGGNGREYIAHIFASDNYNNVSTTDLKIVVPHDKRSK